MAGIRNGNGNGFEQQVAKILRNSKERLNVQGGQIQGIQRIIKRFGSPEGLLGRIETLENCKLSFKEKTIREAAWTIPHTYLVNIALTAAVTRVTGNINVSQWGWFFAERMYICWRPSAGANINRYRPISSGNPIIAGNEAVAAGAVADTLNFLLDISEGRAQRDRQNLPVPGDVFYRIDGDGLIPGGDAYGPNSNVQFGITPTIAPTNAGTCTVVVQGIQCLNATEE